jgi:hypothetical protein
MAGDLIEAWVRFSERLREHLLAKQAAEWRARDHWRFEVIEDLGRRLADVALAYIREHPDTTQRETSVAFISAGVNIENECPRSRGPRGTA